MFRALRKTKSSATASSSNGAGGEGRKDAESSNTTSHHPPLHAQSDHGPTLFFSASEEDEDEEDEEGGGETRLPPLKLKKKKKKKKKDVKRSSRSLMSALSHTSSSQPQSFPLPSTKKPKSKSSVKPESGMTLMSTESKVLKRGKKKPPKSKESETPAAVDKTTKKKKKKNSKAAVIPEETQEAATQSSSREREDALMWSEGEPSHSRHGDPRPLSSSSPPPPSATPPATTTQQNTNNSSSHPGPSLEDDINDDDDDLHDDDDDEEEGPDHLGHDHNSNRFDAGPPIGEILAVATEDDDVSDIGEAIGDGGAPTFEIIDGVEIFYNPDDIDICFDDRYHPGTMDWIMVIRRCLEKFPDEDYSPPVYKAIKKRLRGRRFLIRTRRNERTSWREATKPEIIELFGEAFNEERRRLKEGITEDDSGVDSSLQNSVAQSESEQSLSVGQVLSSSDRYGTPNHTANTNGGKRPPLKVNHSMPSTPTTAPTPRASNQTPGVDLRPQTPSSSGDGGFDFESQSPPRRTKSAPIPQPSPSGQRKGTSRTLSSGATNSTAGGSESHLLQAMREIEDAEEYARPFDDVRLLQQGIEAEEKLNVLLNLSDSSRTVALKAELEKLDELTKRMRIASLAPLLDILTKIERHVKDYYQSMAAEHGSSSSLLVSMRELNCGNPTENDHHAKPFLRKSKSQDVPPTNPRRALEEDPKSDVEIASRERQSGGGASSSDTGGRHNGRSTVPIVNSDHGRISEQGHSSMHDTDASPSKSRNDRSGLGFDQSVVSLAVDELGEEEVNQTQPTTATEEEDAMSQLDEGEEDEEDDEDDDEEEEDDNMISCRHLEGVDGSNRYNNAIRPEEAESVDEEEDEDDFSDVDEEEKKQAGVEYEESFRAADLAGSYKEMALSGSSEYFQNDHDSSAGDEYSDDLNSEKKRATGQVYESSFRTSDLGGSYHEMALAGSSRASSRFEDDDFEESGLSTPSGLMGKSEDQSESEPESQPGTEHGEVALNDERDDSASLQVEEGQVLNLKSDYADDLSSMGRSMPGMYGSDSEEEVEENDGEYEEYEFDYDDMEEEEVEEEESEESSYDYEDSSEGKGEETDEKPNHKLEQFFARLQHFFEVRRKVEERANLMDPAGKLKALKMKQHTTGIVKKNGKFKKEFQQRSMKDKVVRNLDDLYVPAEMARDELTRLLQHMAGDVKGLEPESFVVAPLKQRNKAFDKAQEEYSHRSPGPPESWLFDIVRGSVYCKSYKQLSDVNKWLGKNAHIVTSKNRFLHPCFNGYRDLLFTVSIPYKDDLAHTCEIQVHHKDMKVLDEQFGMPKHYEYFRSCFAGPWRTEQQILEDLSMLNSHGEIGGQCMVKLLKSKDPDQLRLFARLCRDKLDEFDRALELYRRILLLQEDIIGDGEDDDDVADTYLGLGIVLGALGETEESLLNLEKALAIKEALLGTDHLEVAETYTKIGHMLCQKGDYQGALRKYRDALRVRESYLGKEHFLVIRSLQDIGNALRDIGDFKAAEKELNRALEIQESVLGDANVEVAETRTMIGTTLCEYGDYTRAMEQHRLALTIRETTLGKNVLLTANAHSNIGIVLCQKGDYDVAEWRHRKALRIQEAVMGKDDETCAVSLSHLAEVLKRKGDYEGAIKSLKRAIKIRERNFGLDHPISAGSHIDLGWVYLQKRKFDQALNEFRKAKVIRESFLSQNHPDTAVASNAVGYALSCKGEHEAALEEHRRALDIYESVLGSKHPKTATGYQFLADALLAKGDRDDSLIEHRKALAVRASIFNKDHPDTATSCARIGKLLSGKGDLVGALVAYRQAMAITAGLCGEDHPESATCRIRVGAVMAAQGDVDDAMAEVRRALEIRASSLGKDHPDTGRVQGVLGTLHSMQGEFTEAQEFHKKCLYVLERKLGKKHPDAKKARQHLLKAVEKTEESSILANC